MRSRGDEPPACRGVTTARPNALVFLDPELIHTGESVRPFGLERMPAIEIAHETLATENVPILLHDSRREFEADEVQVVLDDEGLNVWNRQPAFLDMEQQI